MKRYIRIISLSLFVLISSSLNVSAHPGNTDKFGGHYDRTTGLYHFHNGGTVTVSNNNADNGTSNNYVPNWLITDSSRANITGGDLKKLNDRISSLEYDNSSLKLSLESKERVEASLNKVIKDKEAVIKQLDEVAAENETAIKQLDITANTLESKNKVYLITCITSVILLAILIIKHIKLLKLYKKCE